MVDGTGEPAYKADVAVKNGVTVAVAPTSSTLLALELSMQQVCTGKMNFNPIFFIIHVT